MLALGSSLQADDAEAYLKQARKKWSKLRDATAQFAEIQPEISTHMNFKMARTSLERAVREVGELLDAE